MACDLTLGRLEDCKDQIGGIDAVYFVNFGDLGTLTVGSDDEITDADGTFSAYKYELKGTNNLEQTINSSRETGTTFFSQVLNLQLKKLSKEQNKELKLMAWGRPHVVVADRNGNAWLVGQVRGAEVTGGTIVTGSAMGDLAGYTINLTADEPTPAAAINGAVVDDPFAGWSGATDTIVVGV